MDYSGDSDGTTVATVLLVTFGLLFVLAVLVIGTLIIITVRKDPTRPGATPRSGSMVHALGFWVGANERHWVVFMFDQMWGWLTITVDGVVVVKKLTVFSFSLVSAFDIQVGYAERHNVHIEKHRPLLLAFARPQPIYAYVDGVLVAQAPAPIPGAPSAPPYAPPRR